MRTLSRLASGVLFAAIVLLLLMRPPASAEGPVDVDLELVMAVDISMSMDPDEQKLQREGYLEAFRDPTLVTAIRGGGRHRRIAVTYVEWAGPGTAVTVIPWQVIDSQARAAAFVAELARQPYNRRSRTSIASALQYAQAQFGAGGFRGNRRVIDVSGDGVNNSGPLMSVVRPQVLATGTIINGLPILIKPTTTWTAWDAPDLDLYYATCVIGGPGSFSIPILKREDFVNATRQKILLEIAKLAPETSPAPRVIRTQATPGKPGKPAEYDCSLVEYRLQRQQGQ